MREADGKTGNPDTGSPLESRHDGAFDVAGSAGEQAYGESEVAIYVVLSVKRSRRFGWKDDDTSPEDPRGDRSQLVKVRSRCHLRFVSG